MFFDPIICFFLAGICIKSVCRRLHVPALLNQAISMFILVTIGIKGGIELCTWSCARLGMQTIAVVLLGLCLFVCARFFLLYVARYTPEDANCIAAHYGSVSVTTFAVGISVIQSSGIFYEPYMPLFVGLMELPAVIAAAISLDRMHTGSRSCMANIVRALSCKSVLVLLFGIGFGYFFGIQLLWLIKPIFFDNFRAVLALLLVEMGILVGDEFSLIKERAATIIVVAITLTLGCAFLGLVWALLMGLSAGGTVLLMLLASSASYIAVPAVLRQHTSSRHISFALGHALGVTFPFNIFIGIYVYMAIVNLISPFWFLF